MAMSQKLPVIGFKWIDDLSGFTKGFIRNYDKNSDIGYLLEVDIEYPKTLWGLHKDLPFLPERKKLSSTEKLIGSIEDKEKICNTHKHIKASTRSWVNIKKRYIE